MKVTLCSIPSEEKDRDRSDGPSPIVPKVAIASLNHWTVKNGFDQCKFYDLDMLYPSDQEIEKYFEENPADIVGLSAVVSTSYRFVKNLARIIKKVNKHTLIVCGGYLTAAANTILRKTDIDICVVGDGEIAWVGILKFMKQHLDSGKNQIDFDEMFKVKGIAILDNEKKNLKFSGYGQRLQACDTSFPSLDYLKSGLPENEKALNNYFRPFYKTEEFPMDKRCFDKGRKPMVFGVFTTKGCVAKCTFCQRGSKGYITYNLDKLEAHIKELNEKYNVGFIRIMDENFGSNINHALQVGKLFNKYNLLWSVAGVRCKSFNKEILATLQSLGLSYIKFGIESGSQTMLDIMEKKFTVEDVKKAIFSCNELGLYTPLTGFMIGMPGESMRTARETGRLMGELAANVRVPLSLIQTNPEVPYCIPLIGTPMYEYGMQLGIIERNVDKEEEFLLKTSDASIYKRYYINFNGAPMSEVVFWDMLVFLEASRTYHKLMKGKKEDERVKKLFSHKVDIQDKNVRIIARKTKIEEIITNFVKQHVVYNKFVAKLPRFLVDPIVRYLLYFEFLIQKHFFKEKTNLHTFINPLVNKSIRIKEEDLNPLKTTQKDRSLRSIVAKKMLTLNKTNQDKVLSSLTGGA